MYLSGYFYKTIKEIPADAELKSHILLIRGGYIKQVGAGIFTYLPIALRCLKKIEKIIREEMDAAGGYEINMPVTMPASLWMETGRYETVGSELLRFEDRTGRKMVLGMTHEEAVTDLARYVMSSYKELPIMLYQIQTKFRDEPRSRGGLVRVREFVMKDAYSFHISQEDLESYYEILHKAYENIFRRCGLPVISVASDTGMMGGAGAHEFMALTESGEDTLLLCDHCGYKANQEVAATARSYKKAQPLPLEEVHTPGYKTIREVASFLEIEPEETMKSVIYELAGNPLMCLLRGDLEINGTKLKNYLKVNELAFASIELLQKHNIVEGYASPLGIRNIRTIVDPSVAESSNLTGGANKKDFHIKNINFGRDFQSAEVIDIALTKEEEPCPECGNPLIRRRGIEVGNIFKLGTKYSQAMKATVLDETGKPRELIMGCYGIGIGRLMASVLELTADEKKITWPLAIAPFEIELIGLGVDKDQEVSTLCSTIYKSLTAEGMEVLYDDRKASPGIKFNDADLIGSPIRITIGKRSLENGGAEVQSPLAEKETVPLTQLTDRIRQIRSRLLQ